MKRYQIPEIDIVIVDLYPFEKTLAAQATEQEIIEKIDIGGISLIRAAAKNYQDVLCVSSMADYGTFLELLNKKNGKTELADRKLFAAKAFNISSHYDTAIFNYFNKDQALSSLKISHTEKKKLRYGENPHQKGGFFGNFNALFDKLHGKELSYNNLLDIDAATNLMAEFIEEKPTFAILKHNNACGIASKDSLAGAYSDALAGDPISAFGGILIANKTIDLETAEKIHSLFCEVVIAPDFDTEALKLLQEKKNRILLKQKEYPQSANQIRSCLNGFLVQDSDTVTDNENQITVKTETLPTDKQIRDLLFASKICKHTKSNTIVLAKNQQLYASGTGQTSRVDALKQAIAKAKQFEFDLEGAVMASDAFFPFPDCVKIAKQAGITAVIQPGGSVKDHLSIAYCNDHQMAMVFTGVRHFKH